MAAELAKEFEALEAQAATLLDTFRNAGYEQVAPAILQPADVFLDRIGEQIRSRTYVFTDLAGDELCLRPDLTVPVSRLYLERHPDGRDEARYCYNGPAFRFQPEADNRTRPREFRQAGIECFGDDDKESADVEIVLLAVEAVRRAGLKHLALRFGDIAMFYALLDALSLPERWRLKLRHYFWRPSAFHALLSRLARGERPNGDGPALALAGALAGETQDRAEERIAAYLEENGLPLAGNRTLGEIAARLLDQSADLGAGPLRKEVAVVIDSYLAISGPPEKARRARGQARQGGRPRPFRPARRLRPPPRASREERRRSCARDLRHGVRPQPRILFGPRVSDRVARLRRRHRRRRPL